jgi:hypothetical protein
VFEIMADVPSTHEHIRRALASESSAALIRIVFDARYAPLFDDSGNGCGAVGVSTDMTERTRAESGHTHGGPRRGDRGSGRPIWAGGSIGIARTPLHGSDASTLLRRANIAMYEAKRVGADPAICAAARRARGKQRLRLAA